MDEQRVLIMNSCLIVRVFLPCHDEAARFVKLAAKPDCNYLEEDDFFILIQVGFCCNEVIGVCKKLFSADSML